MLGQLLEYLWHDSRQQGLMHFLASVACDVFRGFPGPTHRQWVLTSERTGHAAEAAACSTAAVSHSRALAAKTIARKAAAGSRTKCS